MTRHLERAAGVATVAAMLATPFTPPRSRRRLALTWVTVLGGATRTWAVERRRRGAPAATATASGVVAATLAAEMWGVRAGRLFGGYRYTARLRPLVGGVPALVPLAWYAVVLPARATAARALGPSVPRPCRVALGAVAMTAWDLFLDPQMTADDAWRWSSSGRYRGIPARNYVGWLVVAAALMAAIEAIEATGEVGADDAHVVTYGLLGILETVAFSTFWRDPLVASAGGLGMLPIAGVALAR